MPFTVCEWRIRAGLADPPGRHDFLSNRLVFPEHLGIQQPMSGHVFFSVPTSDRGECPLAVLSGQRLTGKSRFHP